MIRSTTPSCVASCSQLLAAAGDQRDRAFRQPGGQTGFDRHRRQHGVGVRGHRRAAQHDRVARLQAQRGRVDRDVRPRLVDDRDHAERHPHLAHVEPVGEPEAVDHLADGIGQRRDVPDLAGDRGDPAGVEREPVQQRVGQPRLAAGLEVAGVGLEDLRRPLDQLVGDRLERGVLDAGAAALASVRAACLAAAQISATDVAVVAMPA